MEHTLVELKAHLEDAEKVKEKLKSLGAEYVGAYHQFDTYYKVSQGRLKLRELEGFDGAHLIYYERGDLDGPKQSKVWIAKVQDTIGMKELFAKLFHTGVIVDKLREIYMYNGIQLHLDQVEGLGSYIEMEKKLPDRKEDIRRGYQTLRETMTILEVRPKNLEPLSYSDLLEKDTSEGGA